MEVNISANLVSIVLSAQIMDGPFYNNVTIQSQSNIFPDFRVALTYET